MEETKSTLPMICAQCGQEHPIDEMELSFRRPDDVLALSVGERERTVQESNDLCVIDGKRFFIRAVLSLPVEARASMYNIGLWVEVGQSAFKRVYELWTAPEQADEPPFAALIANAIPLLPDTIGVTADLQLSGPTTRPEVVVTQVGHPLHTEQMDGITHHRAHEYSALVA